MLNLKELYEQGKLKHGTEVEDVNGNHFLFVGKTPLRYSMGEYIFQMNNCQGLKLFYDNGEYVSPGDETHSIKRIVPPKRKFWINILKEKPIPNCHSFYATGYPSKEAAESHIVHGNFLPPQEIEIELPE